MNGQKKSPRQPGQAGAGATKNRWQKPTIIDSQAQAPGRTDFADLNRAALLHCPDLLERLLPGGRVRGREYVTSCLSGGGGDSLSVNMKSGVWSDFAREDIGGADLVSLVAAIYNVRQGKAAAILSEMIGRPLPSKKEAPLREEGNASGKSQIVKTYDYLNADGELVFQVCRKEPKAFVQRRPGAGGNWIWDLKDVELIPYHLPAILQTQAIFIVEGERDADRLSELGLVATCNAGGAGQWKDQYSEYLRGKRCWVLGDNDDPGRRHAQQIAHSLWGKAEVVKLLSLPGLPEKGDVSDWLDAGGTVEQLQELVEAAQEWQPGQEQESDLPTLQDEDEWEPELKRWPTLPEGALHGLAGEFVGMACEHSEADPAAVLATFLVRFCAEVSGFARDQGPSVFVGETKHTPRLFAAVVGASSKSRKGTSAALVRALFAFPGQEKYGPSGFAVGSLLM